MTLVDQKELAEQARQLLIKRRAKEAKTHSRLRDLNATLSARQVAYVHSRAARRRLLGSRQSGKSHCVTVDHVNTGFESRCESLYIAPTSKSARNAVWSKLRLINNDYELGLELLEGKFIGVFPNGSRLDFEGAHDMARVQRLRGKTIGTGKLTVDETAFFGDKLIRELLGPVATAMFLTGTQRIAVASSPALQRRGMFFELGSAAAWEQHKLTAVDNPAIKDVQQALKDLRAASAWTETTPAYQREGLGLEVDDATHNVYELSDINLIDALPMDRPWVTIMLVDFGDNDESAIAVVGWREHDPVLYVLHVEGRSHIDIEDVCTGVAAKDGQGPFAGVKPLAQRWQPIGIYGDPGGGGAQHMTYMRQRHGIPIRPVAKGQHYKKPAIEALNADMRRGYYAVLRSSPLVQQMQDLQWDPTELARGNWVEHGSMPNDLCDVAGVYASVQAKHFRAEPEPPPKPKIGTAEHWKQFADEGLRAAVATAGQHHADIEAAKEDHAYLVGDDL